MNGNYVEKVREALKARVDDYERWGEDAGTLLDLYALLAISKGQQTTMEDVHHAWGFWTNRNRPDHKDLVPFSLLAAETAEYDRPYFAAIMEVAKLLQEANDRALGWCREDAHAPFNIQHDQASFEDQKLRIFERLSARSDRPS